MLLWSLFAKNKCYHQLSKETDYDKWIGCSYVSNKCKLVNISTITSFVCCVKPSLLQNVDLWRDFLRMQKNSADEFCHLYSVLETISNASSDERVNISQGISRIDSIKISQSSAYKKKLKVHQEFRMIPITSGLRMVRRTKLFNDINYTLTWQSLRFGFTIPVKKWARSTYQKICI